MLTDEQLKEMREVLKDYEACHKACGAKPPIVYGFITELLDEVDRLKGLVDTLSPAGLTVVSKHVAKGVVITVLRTQTGDTVTTFKRLDHVNAK